MSTYPSFIFSNYVFDEAAKTLTLTYIYEGGPTFTETYFFDFEYVAFDKALLERAIQTLFFIAGVSYYKAYMPGHIRVGKGMIDAETGAFFSRTYQQGLGEFYYVNKLDPRTTPIFPVNTNLSLAPTPTMLYQGQLVAIGGGKDSLVSVELLRPQKDIATWSLNHREQLTPLIEKIGLPHFWVERTWDKQLLSLNEQGAMNGHIPISAIFASVGVIVAILTGYKDVVVSNEHSANDPTLVYDGVPINHQYSKSIAFEKDFQGHLARNFGNLVRYYSFLRSLSELMISNLFSVTAFERYKSVFSSCNRAFVHGSTHMSWCGQCAKCAFTFLALTPFVSRSELEQIFGGKNLLLDPTLEPMYKQLLGIEGEKPLDCVGEVKESRAAMRLAVGQYPELQQKYTYELATDYDYRTMYPHLMPDEIFDRLKAVL